MKKHYEVLQMETLRFASEDIITTSLTVGSEIPGAERYEDYKGIFDGQADIKPLIFVSCEDIYNVFYDRGDIVWYTRDNFNFYSNPNLH